MDSDIQFGDVEQLRPRRRRRPDRDRHFAVCTYGTPAEGDLPIFIDVDVMAEIEAHARTNPEVELGGVMLGGQFEDQDGKPFVLVIDSLRAEHYESSRGHFKFTHDTWEQISRRRDEFSDDLQMVGWYHTHPNWGVFLSGMDRFICENFFNRPLDVALVVDPLRGDRGWFYWDHQGGEKLPRAKGFGVVASRFRRRELQDYVELLEEDTAMTTKPSPGATGRLPPQHVIHSIRPQLGWVGAAVLAMLVLQLCTTLLVALRLGAPEATDPTAAGEPAGRQEQIAELDRRELGLAAREEVFDELLGRVKVDPDGSLDVELLVEEYKRLRHDADQRQKTELLLSEAARWIDQDRKQLQAEAGLLEESKLQLAARNEKLREEIDEIEAAREADKEATQEVIAQLKKQLAEATGEDEEAEDDQHATGIWTWENIVAAVIGALVLLAAAAVVIRMTIVRRRRLS